MSGAEQRRRANWAAVAVPCGCALVLLVVAWLPEAWQGAGALRRDGVWSGQLWRLWTGHLVHFGFRHALFDAIALAALMSSVLRSVSPKRLALAGAVVAPLLSLAVLGFEPALQEYRGASGLVVVLFVWVGVDLWRRHRVARRWLVGLGAALLVKLAWDAWPGRAAGSAVLPPGVTVAWSAHLAGALLGGLLGVFRTAPGPLTR